MPTCAPCSMTDSRIAQKNTCKHAYILYCGKPKASSSDRQRSKKPFKAMKRWYSLYSWVENSSVTWQYTHPMELVKARHTCMWCSCCLFHVKVSSLTRVVIDNASPNYICFHALFELAKCYKGKGLPSFAICNLWRLSPLVLHIQPVQTWTFLLEWKWANTKCSNTYISSSKSAYHLSLLSQTWTCNTAMLSSSSTYIYSTFSLTWICYSHSVLAAPVQHIQLRKIHWNALASSLRANFNLHACMHVN